MSLEKILKQWEKMKPVDILFSISSLNSIEVFFYILKKADTSHFTKVGNDLFGEILFENELVKIGVIIYPFKGEKGGIIIKPLIRYTEKPIDHTSMFPIKFIIIPNIDEDRFSYLIRTKNLKFKKVIEKQNCYIAFV